MKLIKTLLVWLLLLALPLQGQAAAALNFCSTGVTTPPAAQAHCHVVKAGTMHDAPQHAADSHCQDAAGSHHKCSSCANCAVGAPFVPAWSSPLSAKPAGAERIDYIAHHLTSRVPDGLERPPHTLAA